MTSEMSFVIVFFFLHKGNKGSRSISPDYPLSLTTAGREMPKHWVKEEG